MSKIIYALVLFTLVIEPALVSHHSFSEENKNVKPQKILVFSYGSLVRQKKNKKTGAMIKASDFIKTNLSMPLSFTFIAGIPPYLLYTNNFTCKNFNTRRATATIDQASLEYKPLWVAISHFSSLNQALNNLAAREGAPLLPNNKAYDLTHIFYIKKIGPEYKKLPNEKIVPGFKEWVTKKALQKRQQLTKQQLQQLVVFTINQQADAAIWVALPSHVYQKDLIKRLKTDHTFAQNTAHYIEKMPPGNILTPFEKKVFNSLKP